MNRDALRSVRGLLLPLAAVVVVAHLIRPLLPIDETRYLAVAWEMWHSGDFLVPRLNGEIYTHKPPLLFWLMHAGWSVFGVQEWWARLVPALASLLSLFLIARIAAKLFPDRARLRRWAPRLAFACIFWQLFATMVMFDFLITACSLLALDAVIDARHRRPGAWWRFALAIGLGVLAKGPVILIYALPPALAAPTMLRGDRPPVWFSRLLLAVLGGALLALAWAIPAAVYGGPEFRDAIFWGQTAGRLSDSFAHARPIWWYLVVFPGMCIPLTLWPRFWRGWGKAYRSDHRVRFLWACSLPVVVLFTLISGKQPHYLLPMIPILALMLARCLEMQAPEGSRHELRGVGVLLLVIAGVFAFGPYDTPWWAGIPPLLASLWLLLPHRSSLRRAVGAQAILGAALIIYLHLTAMPAAMKPYRLQALADAVSAVQQDGRPVAFQGRYYGQLQFLGRLQQPLTVLDSAGLGTWASEHPDGVLVVFRDPRSTSSRWSPSRWQRSLQHGPYKRLEYALMPAIALLPETDRAQPLGAGN